MEQHRNRTRAEPWQPPRHAAGTCRCHRFPAAPCAREREQPTSDTPRPTGDVSTGSGGGRGQRGRAVIRTPTVPTRCPQALKSTRLTATGRQKRSPHRSPSRSRCRWVGTSAQPSSVGLSTPTHRRSPARPARATDRSRSHSPASAFTCRRRAPPAPRPQPPPPPPPPPPGLQEAPAPACSLGSAPAVTRAIGGMPRPSSPPHPPWGGRGSCGPPGPGCAGGGQLSQRRVTGWGGGRSLWSGEESTRRPRCGPTGAECGARRRARPARCGRRVPGPARHCPLRPAPRTRGGGEPGMAGVRTEKCAPMESFEGRARETVHRVRLEGGEPGLADRAPRSGHRGTGMAGTGGTESWTRRTWHRGVPGRRGRGAGSSPLFSAALERGAAAPSGVAPSQVPGRGPRATCLAAAGSGRQWRPRGSPRLTPAPPRLARSAATARR